jgi:hypothetical protein
MTSSIARGARFRKEEVARRMGEWGNGRMGEWGNGSEAGFELAEGEQALNSCAYGA